jgi:hypothetical protein
MPPIRLDDIIWNRPHVRALSDEYWALGTLAADLLLDDEIPVDWGITAEDGLHEIEDKASRSALGSAFDGQHHAAVIATDGFVRGFFERLGYRLDDGYGAFVWWSDFGRRRPPH